MSGFPHLCADLMVGTFIAGHYLLVTRKSAKDADLEKLEDLDEIWALCFRKPRPGWRLLGRFLEPDAFVGLRLCGRNKLGHRKDYGKKASIVIDDWNARFPGLEPLRGEKINDYLGGHFRDVDEKIK